VRTVFVFLEPGEMKHLDQVEGLQNVEGEGPVRTGCDLKNGRMFIFMTKGLDENTLARELSVSISRIAARDWLYVGAIVDVA